MKNIFKTKEEINENMITYDDLLDWEDEFKESIILNGPLFLTIKEEDIFINTINNRKDILEYLGVTIKNIEDIYIIDHSTDPEFEKWRKIIYTLFAEFLSEIGYNSNDLR